MKVKENLTVNEATKYAKNNGFDSIMFAVNLNGKYLVSGKFIDAYYDIIHLPILGNGYTRFKEMCEVHGERNISIDIVDEKEFKAGVSLDFIVRGKLDIPEEYKLAE